MGLLSIFKFSHFQISKLMQSIPDFDRPVLPERAEKLHEVIARRQPTLTVIMENIHDPHNISAMLRSCDAVGVLEVYIINTTAPAVKKLGKKSSASARKWVDVKYFSSVEACMQELKSKGFKIFATHLSAEAKGLHELQLTEPVALAFGNEHHGVSEELLKYADGNFIIPMVGMIQSLNVSVACAVSLYEAFRQRQAAGLYDQPQISEAARTEMFRDWSWR
jgi:tRNA (guanosine-2'-O-)-methyltransferase